MTRARRRPNARRTWDDGGGPDGLLCPQRPLFPHEPNCPGWDWMIDEETSGRKEGDTLVYRCRQCRTFDGHEEATDHVRHCPVCSGRLADELAEWLAARQRRGKKPPAPRLVLGSYGISVDHWDAWINYVEQNIDGRCDFPVEVEYTPFRDQDGDMVHGASDDQEEVILQAIGDMWDDFGQEDDDDDDDDP